MDIIATELPETTPESATTATRSGRPERADTKTLGAAVRLFAAFPGPRFIALVMIVAWSARLWVGNFGWWDLAVMAAIPMLWPLQEWLIHVFILHFKPRKLFGRTIDLYPAYKHRVHHQDPWKLEHVFIPTRTLPVSLAAIVAAWFLLMPSTELFLSGIAVYVAMSLVYEWTHYLIHTNYRPKSGFYKRLWKNHRLHHFKNEHYWFGVSMLAGDRLLNTAPDYDAVEMSSTCRTVHDVDGD
ncbi:MAG: sterol desaturase family protein [Bradymonadaceae bacterium]|nr:sterol desaturase family protein [Lujinxingiaceae bacterium]